MNYLSNWIEWIVFIGEWRIKSGSATNKLSFHFELLFENGQFNWNEVVWAVCRTKGTVQLMKSIENWLNDCCSIGWASWTEEINNNWRKNWWNCWGLMKWRSERGRWRPAQWVNQSSILNQFTALSELMELIDLLMSGAATHSTFLLFLQLPPQSINKINWVAVAEEMKKLVEWYYNSNW